MVAHSTEKSSYKYTIGYKKFNEIYQRKLQVSLSHAEQWLAGSNGTSANDVLLIKVNDLETEMTPSAQISHIIDQTKQTLTNEELLEINTKRDLENPRHRVLQKKTLLKYIIKNYRMASNRHKTGR
jgi:hypothetical protein